VLKKIGIWGYFGFGLNDYGGQPVKTNNLYYALLNVYNDKEITVLDTQIKKNKILFFIRTVKMLSSCKNIIILPAHNGIKYIPKLYFIIKKIFNRHSKIHYVVIGGWLPQLLLKNDELLKQVAKIDFVYVETQTMMRKLNELRLQNITVMKNIKKLEPIFKPYENSAEFLFCYYARVIQEKGIECLIKAIYEVNNHYGRNLCKLHIYGPIDVEYVQKIKSLIDDQVITYNGIVNTNFAPDILSNYYMQIFPTLYFTEGIPGSIIDSFYSGLPVIASKWESATDVINNEYNGILYDFNDFNDLVDKIIWSVENKEKVLYMRKNCIETSKQYEPLNAIKELINNISGDKNGNK